MLVRRSLALALGISLMAAPMTVGSARADSGSTSCETYLLATGSGDADCRIDLDSGRTEVAVRVVGANVTSFQVVVLDSAGERVWSADCDQDVPAQGCSHDAGPSTEGSAEASRSALRVEASAGVVQVNREAVAVNLPLGGTVLATAHGSAGNLRLTCDSY